MPQPPVREICPSPTLTGPLFPEVGVIGLVPDEWGGPWTVRHHVLTRLAKYFTVQWVNPPRPWRELWLRGPRVRRHAGASAPAAPGLYTHTPGKFEARFYRPASLARTAERRRLSKAAGAISRLGCRRFVVYLWRPQFAAALDLVDHDVSCYHIDDEYTFSSVELPVTEDEAGVLMRVGHVFIHSPALYAKKAAYNSRTQLIPTGADYESFAAPRAEPADIREVPHPRIGYVGCVKGQLNLPLLAELAEAHQDWSFVFVGPLNPNISRHTADFERLSTRPNVRMLGGRSVEELPAYVQHMDVLTLPYRVNDYTKFISPMKLNEYLASGKPVVSSPIAYVRSFSDVVVLAETPDEWSAALSESLEPAAVCPRRVKQRRSVASRHDWNRIVLRIAWAICESLGSDYVRALSRAYSRPSGLGGPGVHQASVKSSGALETQTPNLQASDRQSVVAGAAGRNET